MHLSLRVNIFLLIPFLTLHISFLEYPQSLLKNHFIQTLVKEGKPMKIRLDDLAIEYRLYVGGDICTFYILV